MKSARSYVAPFVERSLLPWLSSVQVARLSRARFVICMTLAALPAGCGSSGAGRLVPVAGKVTLDGKPLATGSLVFKPDAAKGNAGQLEPSGTLAGDGSYALFTKEKPGAPVGWYKVGVVAQQASPNDPYLMKSLVPERYNDAESSGLAVEVVASPAANAYDLKLAR